jgi:signal transduction histidine kinase
LFGLLGSVLLLLYFLIRRMFKPIEAISEQVRNIGEGHLEQAVETGGKGEIALLASGINRMSEQIKEMLESKSSLLLAISHELRSPITRMRVNLELLNESDIQQKLIEDIREMETLIAAILESEKLSGSHAPLTRSRCEVLNLVEDVVCGHPCLNRIKTCLSPVEANVDQVRLKLLIKNLIDNACNYSFDDQTWIEVSLRKDRDSVVIEVQDHGVGINPEDIPRLTEAFYRPDASRQRETGGYGLGLYLCQLIARAHGGEIVFESEPGKGTRVIVNLPLDNS